jgi:hypothetical protein
MQARTDGYGWDVAEARELMYVVELHLIAPKAMAVLDAYRAIRRRFELGGFARAAACQ